MIKTRQGKEMITVEFRMAFSSGWRERHRVREDNTAYLTMSASL